MIVDKRRVCRIGLKQLFNQTPRPPILWCKPYLSILIIQVMNFMFIYGGYSDYKIQKMGLKPQSKLKSKLGITALFKD